MITLNSDRTFQYELLRILGVSRDRGADIGEVLNVASQIEPGNFASWYEHFYRLAQHVEKSISHHSNRHRVTIRNAMFRAATYYRAADFFLHGKPDDPRICETWIKAVATFDRAISQLDVPAKRISIKADGFDVPAIFYRPADDDLVRPTLLLVNGYDGSQEEMLHAVGFAALDRGFNVVTFEGPGQPSVVRSQGLGFINEWEKVVTPVVDFCTQQAIVDSAKIALLGYSFGGYLAPRAAAYEHRFAALLCVDGLFDVSEAFTRSLSPNLLRFYQERKPEDFNRSIAVAMEHNTNIRWAVEHGCWSFQAATPFEFLDRARKMSMLHIASNIRCPVLVCEAAEDQFFGGQPQHLVDALGPLATYCRLTAADSAGEHCHVGASDVLHRVTMDWLEETLKVV